MKKSQDINTKEATDAALRQSRKSESPAWGLTYEWSQDQSRNTVMAIRVESYTELIQP